MSAATMRDSQPFLKELVERKDHPNQHGDEVLDEQMPKLNDVRMVNVTSDDNMVSALIKDGPKKSLAPPSSLPSSPPERAPSHDDMRSIKSEASTAEMSSFESESTFASTFGTSRLYGRETEEKALVEAFERIMSRTAPRKSEYVVISGACGTGKTRLGESLEEVVGNAGGYLVSGKFDQHQDDPFAPIMASFNDFVRQVLSSDDETIRATRSRVHNVLGEDLKSMTSLFPPLATLMEREEGPSDMATSCSCEQQQGRILFTLNKLMRAISCKERPLVLMLDDIQWASRCPLAKLRAMINDDMNDNVMFLGICRDDAPHDSPLNSFLRQLDADKVEITNISIGNLGKQPIEEMVNEVFLMPEEQSKSLTHFVYSHSNGNAYFVVESLRMLQQESRMLHYDKKTNTWSINHDLCTQMMDYCPQTFMERKLRAMPHDLQKLLMAASCLGSRMTERLVEATLQEPVKDRFKQLVKMRKFIYDDDEKVYSFNHNAFQTVCYNLITRELQPAFHLEIGLRLWSNLDEEELDRHLFVVLSQLQAGEGLLQDQSKRYEVAALCVRAAEKAAARFSFPTAADFLNFAFTLLGPKHWDEAFDLSLVIYNYAAEVELAMSDNSRVDDLIGEVLKHADSIPDRVRANTTKIYALGGRGHMDKAIHIGIGALEELGVHIKPQCHKRKLVWSVARIGRMLRGKSDERLKRIPHMTDGKKLAAMQILNMLFLNTFLSRQDLFPHVVLKMMKLTLVDGLSALSSVAFAGYGLIMCSTGYVEEGMRYGKIALDLVDDFDAVSFKSRVGAIVWGSIMIHTQPYVDSLEHLKEGHGLGLRTGDSEFAMQNSEFYVMFMIASGKYNISEIIAAYRDFKDLNELHGHDAQGDMLVPLIAGFEKLRSSNANLRDHPEELDKGVSVAKEQGNSYALALACNAKQFLHILTGDYEAGTKLIDERDTLVRLNGSIHDSFCLFSDSLTCFGDFRRTSDPKKGKKLLKRCRRNMKQLKQLSKRNPAACLGKYVLLEAENAAVSKKHALAKDKYDHAIALGAKYGSTTEVAIANQTAGEHFAVDIVDKKQAVQYFKAACAAYEKWGATAAVALMKKRIAQLE